MPIARDEAPGYKEWYETARLIGFARRMNPRYRAATFHKRIANRLEHVARGEIQNLCIMLPPRHGKSELASVNFPAWYLGKYPDSSIIACSYAFDLVRSFSRRARNMMTSDVWPFPDVRPAQDSRSVADWGIEGRRGNYHAAGVRGGITGRGCQILLIDDPTKNRAEAESEVMREHTWQWYINDAYTRLEPNGAVVLIGTHWHGDDLLGRALNQEGVQFELIKLPAIAGGDDWLERQPGDYLWPERLPPDWYEKLRTTVGPRVWNALYQQDPIDDEGAMFPRDAWGWYGPRDLPPLTEVAIAVDSAFKEGVGSDYSVFAAWGHDGHGRYYLLDLWRSRVEFPALILAGHAMYAKWTHAARKVALVVEDKASGQSAIQVWRKPYAAVDERDPSKVTRYPAIPVIAFPVSAGQSKVARADGITHVVHSHQSFLPAGQAWTAEFVQEHVEFPLGAHDDQVDSTSIALTHFLNPPKRGFRTY